MESHTHVSFDLLGNLESYFNEEFKTEDIENERLDTASQLLLIIFVLRIWTLKVEIYVTISRVFPVHFIVWLTPNKESASRTHNQNKSPVLTDDECLTIHVVPKCLKKKVIVMKKGSGLSWIFELSFWYYFQLFQNENSHKTFSKYWHSTCVKLVWCVFFLNSYFVCHCCTCFQ